MLMIYCGTVKDKVIALEAGVELHDGAIVQVQLAEPSGNAPSSQNDPFCIGELAVDTGISDLAANADHYLYGHPKTSHGG